MSACVTMHEAEEACDCLCVYRTWRQVVRDLEINDGLHGTRLLREKELYRELGMFPLVVRREAERMSR